jgi:hypothetical protein
MPGPRIAVLLGAGASADAGLPLTSQLAHNIVERANDENPRFPAWVRALNFIYGSMVGHQAADGSNPLGAVNIEHLISAVRLLRQRDTHEAAPFVSAWRVLSLGGTDTRGERRSLGGYLKRAIDDTIGDRPHSDEGKLFDAIAEIYEELSGTADAAVYDEVEGHLLLEIKKELLATESVDYLRPIADLARAQPGGLDVITLNYDLTIETLAAETDGLKLDTGITRWGPGKRLAFRKVDGQINLFKLHGSLDWEVTPPREDKRVNAPGISSSRAFDLRARPWIVVGDREKLATDGPTLALLRGAEDALGRTDHLVVVGYSFADGHINAMVRDWMLGNAKRTLSILEYEWPTPRSDYGMRGALVRAYASRLLDQAPGSTPRLRAFAGRTRDVLREALTSLPEPDPDPYVVISTSLEGGLLTVEVENRGPDLFDVGISAGVVLPPQPDLELGAGLRLPGPRTRAIDLRSSVEQIEQNPHRAGAIVGATLTVGLGLFRRNEKVMAFGAPPDDAVEVTVTVDGESRSGHREFKHRESVRPEARGHAGG